MLGQVVAIKFSMMRVERDLGQGVCRAHVHHGRWVSWRVGSAEVPEVVVSSLLQGREDDVSTFD